MTIHRKSVSWKKFLSTAVYILLTIFCFACSDSATFNITGFRSQVPSRTLTGVFTQIQFYFETDVSAECGGFCDEAPSSNTEFSLNFELIQSPAGANVDYIMPDLQSWYTLGYVRTFMFKTDTAGEYVFSLTLEGSMTIVDNGDIDADSHAATITVNVDANSDESFLAITEEYSSYDDVEIDIATLPYEDLWTASSGGLVTEAYVLSPADDNNVTFDLVAYDSGDDSMMVPTLDIDGQVYHLPFMLMANSVEYFGRVLFYDQNADGLDELYFSPYTYQGSSYYCSEGICSNDWYDLFDPLYDLYAARLEIVQ